MHLITRRIVTQWKLVALTLVLLGASTVAVQAQETLEPTTVRTVEHEEDNDFPWGLLGLLGLAGLLGRRKKEEVHVHREPARPATGPVVDRTVVRPDDHHGTGGTTGGTRL